MITAAASTSLSAPPDEVFRYVSDPTKEPTWHTDVAEAVLLQEPLGVGSRVRYLFPFAGRKQEAIAEVMAYEPGRLERLRFDGGPMNLSPTITLRVEADGAGSRFTREVEVHPRGFVKLLEPILRRFIAGRNAGFVRNLKQQLDA